MRNNRDFIAGLLFIVLGGLAVALARDYPLGSSLRMGPGYFPTVLGVILFLFGVYVLARGDPTVFFTRPISAAFMIATLLILVVMVTPALRKKRKSA